ncbi:hypothetical protein ABID12_002992 [Martelella mangrovi]|uniref:Uncharacterized protein n=1 Tax=Martelella mangrovi TaxID=1397477 RepID=A0ABV2IDQ1_9HYPH
MTWTIDAFVTFGRNGHTAHKALKSFNRQLIRYQWQRRAGRSATGGTAPCPLPLARQIFCRRIAAAAGAFPRKGGTPAPRGEALAHRSRFKQSGVSDPGTGQSGRCAAFRREPWGCGGSSRARRRPSRFCRGRGMDGPCPSYGQQNAQLTMIERTPYGLRPSGDLSGVGARACAPTGSCIVRARA